MVTYSFKDHEYRLATWQMAFVFCWDFRASKPRRLLWILLFIVAFISIYRLMSSSEQLHGDEVNPKFKEHVAAGIDNKHIPQQIVNDHKQPQKAANQQEIDKILKENDGPNFAPKFPPLDRKFPDRGHERHAPIQSSIRFPKPKEFPRPLLLEPQLDCGNSGVLVIVLVEDRADNTGARLAIRGTWGQQDLIKYPHIPPNTWKTIFIMGKLRGLNADFFHNAVRAENKKHGDILMADFEDTPYECTRKFMTALKWLNENHTKCPTKYVLKTKDNIFHNMFSITEWLQKRWSADDKLLYTGKLRRQDPPIRDHDNPLYIDKNDFADDFFPDMIEGPVYLFDWAAFAKIYKSMGIVTPIAMEDGYISVLAFMSGIKPQHNDHFQLMGKPREVCAHLKVFFLQKMLPKDHIDVFTLNKNARSQGLCPDAKIVYQRGQHAKRVDFDT